MKDVTYDWEKREGTRQCAHLKMKRLMLCRRNSNQDVRPREKYPETLDVSFRGIRVMTLGLDVNITTTRLHFGGVRRWFVCPRCHGRAKKLYSAV